MSIQVTEKNGEIVVKVNGYNYEDLKKAQDKLYFKDIESLIKYAFGIVILHDGLWADLVINGNELKFWPQAKFSKNRVNESMDEATRDCDNIVSFKEYLSKLKDDE